MNRIWWADHLPEHTHPMRQLALHHLSAFLFQHQPLPACFPRMWDSQGGGPWQAVGAWGPPHASSAWSLGPGEAPRGRSFLRAIRARSHLLSKRSSPTKMCWRFPFKLPAVKGSRRTRTPPMVDGEETSAPAGLGRYWVQFCASCSITYTFPSQTYKTPTTCWAYSLLGMWKQTCLHWGSCRGALLRLCLFWEQSPTSKSLRLVGLRTCHMELHLLERGHVHQADLGRLLGFQRRGLGCWAEWPRRPPPIPCLVTADKVPSLWWGCFSWPWCLTTCFSGFPRTLLIWV